VSGTPKLRNERIKKKGSQKKKKKKVKKEEVADSRRNEDRLSYAGAEHQADHRRATEQAAARQNPPEASPT